MAHFFQVPERDIEPPTQEDIFNVQEKPGFACRN